MLASFLNIPSSPNILWFLRRYLGFWMLDSDSPVFLRCLYHVYNKLIITIMFVFVVTLFADICVSFDDISIISDDGCIFAGIFIVLFKVLIFQIRRERITRLFHATIDNCDRLCKFSSENPKTSDLRFKVIFISRFLLVDNPR